MFYATGSKAEWQQNKAHLSQISQLTKILPIQHQDG